MEPDRERCLRQAREAYAQSAWDDAFGLFSEADGVAGLEPDDMQSLAMSAALTARDDAMLAACERMHQMHLEAGRSEEAARAAFWVGFRLFSLGETGRAGAWIQRAQRLLAGLQRQCVVDGYLMLPEIYQRHMQGDFGSAAAQAEIAAAIGERFGDPDLAAFSRNLHGKALIHSGRVREGLVLLDEAMLAAANDELMPIFTGLVYCSTIAACCQIYAMDRAREWTEALAAWCEARPQLAIFNGICMVHRAEIMQINGEWPRAIAEARNAQRRLEAPADSKTAAAACYQEGEIQRLRGEFAAAEDSYRKASRLGQEPQPGLALLRLAQGRTEQAAAAIRQVTGATSNPLDLARLLPGFVEIMLAADAREEAAEGCRRLDAIANQFGTELLAAMAAHARGSLDLAAGDAQAALAPLRSAFSVWHKAGAPYICARIRVLIADACRVLGDDDGAALELDAARAVFEELGAAPDLSALPGNAKMRAGSSGGLTHREVEVLRLVADGKTNRVIARELQLSAKTVDRHLENIFNKLDVSSRAAATACAYRQRLL